MSLRETRREFALLLNFNAIIITYERVGLRGCNAKAHGLLACIAGDGIQQRWYYLFYFESNLRLRK
jgi:hypothetical protein